MASLAGMTRRTIAEGRVAPSAIRGPPGGASPAPVADGAPVGDDRGWAAVSPRGAPGERVLRQTIRRIAVLNRGEAAIRCLRAIRELRAEEDAELAAIALYTDPDRAAAFVRDADEALSLGPALRRVGDAMRPAYLDHDRVLAALRAMRADAVWPGWGFLAEDPAFVEKLDAAGLAFIGPSAETMRLLGDKIASKRLAEAAGVPVAAWSGGPVQLEELRDWARRIGFPLLLKATAGGGGRGIRRVDSERELENAFRSATAEAANAFGDGRLFVEACLSDARHIEVQIAADVSGGVLALGLRDCSVQRRHQKVIEEGPPLGLGPGLLRELREGSVRLARKAGYRGVATCEYLVGADGRAAFLEVNTRLQVEHGVTELLTGWDLVKWQIRIARGELLPREEPAERGHTIEVRLCAEDPAHGFAPSPGRIALLDLPAGPGIRVDAGVTLGETIPAEFDSMIAKLLAHGATREEARARLLRALGELRVVLDGGMTNKGFLLDALAHPDFRAARCTTNWLDSTPLRLEPEPCAEALVAAAIACYQRERTAVRLNFYAEAARGRPRLIPPSSGLEIDLVYAGAAYRLSVFAVGGWRYRVYLGDRVVAVQLLEHDMHTHELVMGGRRHPLLVSESDVEVRVELDGKLHRVLRDVGGKVRAPAPALVIELAVRAGDRVVAGQRLGLLEAMKTETAFFAPTAGVVRELFVRPGERVSAGDALLVIEPEDVASAEGPGLELPVEDDPLEALFDPADGAARLERTANLPAAERVSIANTLRSEMLRLVMGYDVNPARAQRLIEALEAPLGDAPAAFRAELAQLARAVEAFADIETLFSRAPGRLEGDELGPSNDARRSMYLRRIGAEGAGIHPQFLDLVRRALAHYDIHSLAPSDALYRAVLRLHATQAAPEIRRRVVTALLQMLVGLAELGENYARMPELEAALDRLALLRGTVPASVCDLAAQARYRIFERSELEAGAGRVGSVDPEQTVVPPPDEAALAERAREFGLSESEARRIELWRLENFQLERIETFPGVWAFYGRSRTQPGDERIFVFAEVLDLGPGAPFRPDLARFEQRFHAAIEALRSIQGTRDPARRLQWNRLYLLVRPPFVLTEELADVALRRLAPETGHLGLEKVIVRIGSVAPEQPTAPPQVVEVLAGNPTGSRVEASMRVPHSMPLATATPYERRIAAARARGLVQPYEMVRLFTAEPQEAGERPWGPTGAGRFEEYDVEGGRAVSVLRPPGENSSGVVFGVISTPTAKHPEGLRRVLVLSDGTRELGALAAPECERICAALELAEALGVPVEWCAVSAGARIAMDSGTENLDATARVVRRLVTFTDAGGEVNLILVGVNVGAQSYFDALATMGLHTRGILVMLPSSSMVLTGRAALEMSGGVAAEDELGIGGYERIMGPAGEAQYQARDLSDAHSILLQHYDASYRAPGESGPRRRASSDPRDRDVTLSPYDGDEGFHTVGEIFSADSNPDRKRPFAMRPVMRALVDQDAGWLERWRDWAGAETAIVWDAHLGGFPIALVGVESRPIPRNGYVPNDGPDTWTAGTLFPLSSKKVARALNAASGNRPAVILANLSGFDGSPESMRRGILEFGAEIARAVVRFRGKLLFVVVSRYHGGAYVVFSRELNPQMRAAALAGSYASVIGGPAAAAVVFPREVRRRANADPRVAALRARAEAAADPAVRAALRSQLERLLHEVTLEMQAAVAAEFDAVHTVERARQVGSLETILEPGALRPELIRWLEESGSR
jgi:acetyl/propionyl-CoA carboxylase alpha subunit/acetyl-CoA carboxylase carboxyltransferase component